MSANQQGDVVLYQTTDDGEIEVVGGVVTMSGGLETAAYLALFGGNEQDSGRPGDRAEFWGNLSEPDPVRHYRSETQYLLNTSPAIPANVQRINDAVRRDLSFFVDENIASSIGVEVTIPGLNTVKIVITIEADGDESEFEFVENWKSTL